MAAHLLHGIGFPKLPLKFPNLAHFFALPSEAVAAPRAENQITFNELSRLETPDLLKKLREMHGGSFGQKAPSYTIRFNKEDAENAASVILRLAQVCIKPHELPNHISTSHLKQYARHLFNGVPKEDRNLFAEQVQNLFPKSFDRWERKPMRSVLTELEIPLNGASKPTFTQEISAAWEKIETLVHRFTGAERPGVGVRFGEVNEWRKYRNDASVR